MITPAIAVQIVALYTLTAVLIGALVMWLVDDENFPNYGVALWWAAQTVTTVGYGDVVPTNVAGRIVASLVMFTGIALISVVSGAAASGLCRPSAAGRGWTPRPRSSRRSRHSTGGSTSWGRRPGADGDEAPPPPPARRSRARGARRGRRDRARRSRADVRGAALAARPRPHLVAPGGRRRDPGRGRLGPGPHLLDRRAPGGRRGRGGGLRPGRRVAGAPRRPARRGSRADAARPARRSPSGSSCSWSAGSSSSPPRSRPPPTRPSSTIEGWVNDADANGTSGTTQDVKSAVSGAGGTLLKGVADGIEGLTSLAFFLSFTLFSIFFLLKDGPTIKRFIDRHLGRPAPRGDRRDEPGAGVAAALLPRGHDRRRVQRRRGGLGAWILGVPLAGTIAVVTFVTAYVPFIGAFVSGAFAVVLASPSRAETALIMLVIVVLANGVLQQIVQPIAFGATLGPQPAGGPDRDDRRRGACSGWSA